MAKSSDSSVANGSHFEARTRLEIFIFEARFRPKTKFVE